MPRPRQRVRFEDGLKLDLNRLVRQKLVLPGSKTRISIRWNCHYSGEEIASGTITADITGARQGWLRLQLGNLDQWIDLRAEPRHLGGRQWYFLCPVKDRIASVLWKPPGASRFCSRQVWGRQVAYGSQFGTPRDRALSAAQDIRIRLGGKQYISIDDCMPAKPKWMRWRTYEGIIQRCEANEAICNQYLFGAFEKSTLANRFRFSRLHCPKFRPCLTAALFHCLFGREQPLPMTAYDIRQAHANC